MIAALLFVVLVITTIEVSEEDSMIAEMFLLAVMTVAMTIVAITTAIAAMIAIHLLKEEGVDITTAAEIANPMILVADMVEIVADMPITVIVAITMVGGMVATIKLQEMIMMLLAEAMVVITAMMTVDVTTIMEVIVDTSKLDCKYMD